jgi:peptidyl-prolyl cis-trans isomerase SurA
MRNWIGSGLLLLAIGVSGCSRVSGPDASVAARVNGKDILRSEVDNYFNVRSKDLPQKPSGDAANILKLQILQELIEAAIMEQRAEALNLTPTEVEIEAEVKLLQGEVSQEEFRKTLADRGVTEADLRKEIGRNLTIQKVMENQVRAKAKATDAEISSFYEENKEAFNVKEPMYGVGLIAVTTDAAAPVNNLRNDKALNEEQALRKIQMLEARVRAGEDFQQLAREYSEDPQTAQTGGDMGYQTAAMLERFGPAFKDTILKMKPGDLTPVVRVEGGYFLFRLSGKREPGQHDLKSPEVQESIRTELEGRKRQLLSTAFSEQIHNEARVENFLAREVVASFQSAN